jgi:hypothetical protein
MLFPHLLIGAAIGSKIHSFWAISVLAIILHFSADSLPHWEYEIENTIKNKFWLFILKVSIDLGIGLSFIFWFFWNSPLKYYALFGAFMSILPDSFILLRELLMIYFNRRFSWLEKYLNFHEKFHPLNNDRLLFRGIICESLTVALAILLIII